MSRMKGAARKVKGATRKMMPKEGVKKAGAQVTKRAAKATSEAVSGALGQVAQLPVQILAATGATLLLVALGVAFLSLFLVQQAFMWLNRDPERAFAFAVRGLSVVEYMYDAGVVVWNIGVDVLQVALPLWNAGALYVVQPIAFTLLEIISVAFAGKPYRGVLSEERVPFEGYRCPPDGSSSVAAKWCGDD